MPIASRERIGPAVAAVVTEVGHESAHVLDEFGLLEGGSQTYLDQSALRQLDVVEADQRVLGEDDAI